MQASTDAHIRERLLSLADTQYRDFSRKLVPSVDTQAVIGIRVPLIRSLAAELYGTAEAREFLLSLPHVYLEENHLHAFLISLERDFSKTLELTENFLPYIDNWATCDSFIPKAFEKLTEENANILYGKALGWMKSQHEYTARFGICVLMRYFLGERFSPEMLRAVSDVHSEQYYVKMMCAWYIAEALIKQYPCAVGYLEACAFDPWVQNKAISKACDSFRIDSTTKAYLKTLRIKSKK